MTEMQPKDNNPSVKNVPLFLGCDKKRVDKYLAREEVITFPKGDRVLREGTPAKGFYYVHSGVVKLSRRLNGDPPSTLSFLSEGDVLGVDALVDKKVHQYSAEAFSDCLLSFVPREDFLFLFLNESSLQMKVIGKLCKRANSMEERMIDIILKNTRQRIAEHLVRLVDRDPSFLEKPIEFKIKDLAEYIGTTEYYLYKVIVGLTKEGMIRTKKDRLWVLDPQGLEKLLQEDDGGSS